MYPRLDLSKRPAIDSKASRARTLARLRQFKAASDALEDRCKELGIPVPVMVQHKNL